MGRDRALLFLYVMFSQRLVKIEGKEEDKGVRKEGPILSNQIWLS